MSTNKEGWIEDTFYQGYYNCELCEEMVHELDRDDHECDKHDNKQ